MRSWSSPGTAKKKQEFKEGEEVHVCVLLLTQINRLFAQWHGPYKVVKWIGKVTYQIDTLKRNNRYHTLHINMLRKWNSPSATVGFTKELPETNEADDIPCWKDNNGSDLKFSFRAGNRSSTDPEGGRWN